jgi:BlaI family penicillinase repressor
MKISEAEWRVMRVIWDHGTLGAAEVIEAVVPDTQWSHRTVRTLLNRLVAKGALTAELDGERNLYRARVPLSKCVRRESRTFLERVFGGDASALLAHFLQHEDIAPDELKQLKALLNAKKSKQD